MRANGRHGESGWRGRDVFTVETLAEFFLVTGSHQLGLGAQSPWEPCFSAFPYSRSVPQCSL